MRGFLSSLVRAGTRRNMALSLAQAVLAVVCTLAAYRILVGWTDVESLGLWSLTVGLVAFARIADISGGNGLNRLVAVAVLEARGAAPVIDTVTLFTLGLYGLLALAAVLPLQALVVASVPGEYADLAETLVLWALGTLVASVLSTSQFGALDGLRRADIRAALQIAGSLLMLAAAALLIPRHGVTGLAEAQLLQLGFTAIASRLMLMRLMPELGALPVRFSMTDLRTALGYGLKLQASSIAQLIADSGTRVMVNHFAGLAGLAFFDVAQKLGSYTYMMAEKASLPLIAEFSRADRLDRAARDVLYHRLVRVTLPAAGGAFALLCLGGPLVGWFILGTVPGPYLLYLGALAAGWYAMAISLPSFLMARGVGMLRGNILGRWTYAVGSVGLGAAAGLIDERYIGFGVGAGLVAGAAVLMAANARIYALPMPLRLMDRRSQAAALVLAAAVAALLTTGALR